MVEKYKQIEKRTPEGRRWVVVSCGEVACRAVRKMGLEPNQATVLGLIKRAKSNRAVWEIFITKAHELRVRELSSLLKGVVGHGEIDSALVALNQKYAGINEDPERNFSYLDDIVLGNGVDEGKKAAS